MKPLPNEAWNAWSPWELSERLGSTIAPWYIVGGWALDLWHGRQTREHEDLEFAIQPEDIEYFRALLPELTFFTAHEGMVEYLPPQVAPPGHIKQIWGADLKEQCWRADMMMECGSQQTWVYKRDPTIRMPRDHIIRTNDAGISYLAPAAVLLFKAKHCRDKDEEDFRRALPRLQASERADLRNWLMRAHLGHEWIRFL